MADPTVPLARSPIPPPPPLTVVAGWEVSARRTIAPLLLTDLTPLAKVQVRAAWDGAMARTLGVGFGRAARGVTPDRAAGNGASHVGAGALVIGSGPGEWLVLAPPGTAPQQRKRLQQIADRAAQRRNGHSDREDRGRGDGGRGDGGGTGDRGTGNGPAGNGGAVPAELVTITDLTHGRALVRLTGDHAHDLLARLCTIDLADETTPNGTALRTAVARVATDLVRDDRGDVPSYLLHCERSSGRYLSEVLLDAGADLGIDTTGFTPPGI